MYHVLLFRAQCRRPVETLTYSLFLLRLLQGFTADASVTNMKPTVRMFSDENVHTKDAALTDVPLIDLACYCSSTVNTVHTRKHTVQVITACPQDRVVPWYGPPAPPPPPP